MINFLKKPNFLTIMNHGYCDILDLVLNKKLDCGISELNIDGYYINIKFNDGTNGVMWNSNKYYGWLRSGCIDNYEWIDSRPRKKTIRRFEREMIKFMNK